MQKKLDKKKIEKAVKMILEAIGEDPNREGLVETPQRVARMYEEITAGYNQDPKDYLCRTFQFDGEDVLHQLPSPLYFGFRRYPLVALMAF